MVTGHMYTEYELPEERCRAIVSLLEQVPAGSWHVDLRPYAEGIPPNTPKMLVLGLSKWATSTGLLMSPATSYETALRLLLLETVW